MAARARQGADIGVARVFCVRATPPPKGTIRSIATARQALASASKISTDSLGGAQKLIETAVAAVDAIDRFQKTAAQLVSALGEMQRKLEAQGNEYAQDMASAVGEFKVAVSDATGGASQLTETMIGSAKLLRDALADVANEE